ncbi:MutS-related protein [Dyadobacter sp. NIV53]|uniref:MutS-related protein n=1 Tax=Dyadobacter sp. NIV53 TaxID=2861765 RepID=UPI001C88D476|nr:DNA mismatch repair protein MutS [Dyadobacter sp. NIV53]
MISVSSVLLSFIFPQILIFLVLLLAVNFGIHYWNKMNVYQYGSSIPQLLRLNQAAKKIITFQSLKDLDPGIGEAIDSIDSLGMQMSLFKLEVKLQSEIGQAVEYLVELVKALFLIEPLVLYNVLNELDLKRAQMQQVYQFVGEIDAAMSIQFLREYLPYFCFPSITPDKKQITAMEVCHPLIFQSVPNSINLEEKSALLTGSNMSGKTTFIRTMGINAITAQTINTCFANSFTMPVLKIHTAIRISDDLLNDKSYYFEEVLAIKYLLEESGSGFGNLFLLDELFKGTNTVERIASGKAVLSYLNKGNNITFVATHDLELAEFLKDGYSVFHFTEVVMDGEIVFDYRIKPGNLRNTNAIRILELNGYPTEVVEEAARLAREIYGLKINL